MLMLLESTLYLWAFNENRLKYNKHVNRSDFGASLCFPAACTALFLWSAYNSSLRMLYPNSWAGKPKRLKHSSSQIHKMNQYRISNCVFMSCLPTPWMILNISKDSATAISQGARQGFADGALEDGPSPPCSAASGCLFCFPLVTLQRLVRL